MEKSCGYGFGRKVTGPFAATANRVREALQAQGFGILCEIDVAAKLKEKLGADFPPYLILGACNPRLAHQALQAEINLGLLLPCNVVVYEDEAGGVAVMAMDPVAALGVVGNPAVAGIAAQVRELLDKALAELR